MTDFLGKPKWIIWPWERRSFWGKVFYGAIAAFVAGLGALVYFAGGIIGWWQ